MHNRSVRIPLVDIKAQEDNRPAGYYDDVVSRGVVRDGALELSVKEWRRLRDKYTPSRGLGDVVEKILRPIGEPYKAWRLKKTGKPCGCARRQAKLNAMFPR